MKLLVNHVISVNALNEAISSWQYYYGECDNESSFTKIQNKIFDKMAYYVSRIAEDGKMPEIKYLQGNLNRLRLLIPLDTQVKNKIFKQIFSGKNRIDHDKAKRESETKVIKEKSFSNGKVQRAVAVKRRKYERQFASEHDLVLSGYGVFLGRHLKRLVVKKGNARPKEFAVSKVNHVLVLNRSATLSTSAISLCCEHNIPIDFLDYQGKPYARLAAPDQPAWRFGLSQVEALKNGRGCFLAKSMVEGKIRNQINLIKYFSKYRRSRDADFMKIYNREMDNLNKYIDEIEQICETEALDKVRGKLLGIEGRVGAAYWILVRCLIEDRIEFKKRERHGAKDLVNSMLNYGYGILYSRVWGALMRAGLNTQISFLHSPQYGKPTLVYDAVEEFRAQVVDRVIISLINRGEKICQDEKGLLIKESRDKLVENVFERLNTPVKFRKKQHTLQEIIHLQAEAMGKYLKAGKPKYRPFIAKW